MPVTRDMLLDELKALQRLTAFEQAVATVRRTQAATTPIAQELAANAGKAGERLALLAQAVRGAGGTPDVVGPVLGRLGALVQTQVNQVQTLQGSLLGDLALEHQLRERARYARTLAVTLGEMSALPVLDRLDAAHTETIAWLERRLGEVARTGSSAIKATPLQVAVGSVRRVAAVPFTLTVDGVNRVGALVGRLTRSAPAAVTQVQDTAGTVADKAGETAGQLVDTATDLASSVSDTATDLASSVSDTATDLASSAADTVADTVSDAADTVADTAAAVTVTGADPAADPAADDTVTDAVAGSDEDPDDGPEDGPDTGPAETTEEITHEVLEATGGDDVADEKPPFAGYDRITGDSIMRHVDDTEDLEELRVLLAYEQAHKARKGVLKAVQSRLTDLSASV